MSLEKKEHSERTKKLRRRIEEKLRNDMSEEEIVNLAKQLNVVKTYNKDNNTVT